MRRFIIATLIGGLALGGVALATATQEDQKNVCHKTASEEHPWEAIRIDSSAYSTHIGHGDFDYLGPTKDNGHPNDAQDQDDAWCEENAPDEDTPTVNPPTDDPDTPADESKNETNPTTLPGVGADGK